MKPKKLFLENRIIEILESNTPLSSHIENDLLKAIKKNSSFDSWAEKESRESSLKTEIKDSLLDFYRLQQMIDEGRGNELLESLFEDEDAEDRRYE